MKTCQFSASHGYDPTLERAEYCGRASVGQCVECASEVCLIHGELCACGKILCETCRISHQAECELYKLETFRKCAAPEHRTYVQARESAAARGEN